LAQAGIEPGLWPSFVPSRIFLFGAVLEAREFLEKRQRHIADGAVALLGDDERGLAFGLLFFIVALGVILLTDQEADEIGVLLDAAGFPQIAQAGAALGFAATALGITVELR
jgi:hypothetical protein